MKGSIRTIRFGFLITVIVTVLIVAKTVDASAQPPTVECPCDFDSVPMTTGCWVEQFVDPIGPSWITTSILPKQKICAIAVENFDVAFALVLQVTHFDPHSAPQCMIEPDINDPAACGDPPHQTVLELTPREVRACQCELLAYVTALNEVDGISVSGGPPYECGNVDCRQLVPSPIPTLNEYGMIITAGVLGLLAVIGLFVIRRRKVSA
jgi:hypothetical protein